MIDYDEDSFSRRTSRLNTRRRTKDRPDYSDAQIGRVIGIDRGRITCALPDGVAHEQQVAVTAVKARELGRKGVVIGDRVRLVGDLTGKPDTLARLVEVLPRESVLMRTADDQDAVERIIVANADQMAIVTATANPEPRTGLIDRALVAAYEANIAPLLIITKSDLASPDELLHHYENMNLECIVLNAKTGSGIEQVRSATKGHVTVFIGHSGVGKSTLVNALVPEAARATGSVNDVTGRGKHTSTSTRAIALPDDSGWVIDTPGVRSFGIAHVVPEHIIASFDDLIDGTEQCPRACSHVNETGQAPPDCALDAWVEQGNAGPSGPSRLISLRRLLLALQTSPS